MGRANAYTILACTLQVFILIFFYFLTLNRHGPLLNFSVVHTWHLHCSFSSPMPVVLTAQHTSHAGCLRPSETSSLLFLTRVRHHLFIEVHLLHFHTPVDGGWMVGGGEW